MTRKYQHLIIFPALLSIALWSTNVFCGSSNPEAEAAAGNAVVVGLAPAMNALNVDVIVALVTDNAAAIAASIGNDAISGCAGGSGCAEVFRAIMQYLNKLLTPEYRMTNSIHLLRPDKVEFSESLAQQLAGILMKSL